MRPSGSPRSRPRTTRSSGSKARPPGRRPAKGKGLAGPRRARRDGPADRTKPRGTAKDRALLLLGVRWRSREELRTRLAKAGFEPEEVERSLEDLEHAGLIDDQRFAREMVRSQANGRLAGDRAIRSALRRTGVAPEDVETALADAPDESGRARDLAERRARSMGALAPEAAYRRLFGQLVRRGYPPALARDAAREALAAAGGPGDLPESDP